MGEITPHKLCSITYVHISGVCTLRSLLLAGTKFSIVAILYIGTNFSDFAEQGRQTYMRAYTKFTFGATFFSEIFFNSLNLLKYPLKKGTLTLSWAESNYIIPLGQVVTLNQLSI